ncbi:MAG: LexA repressor [Phycisphaerae bacterium]|nr:LexA repressor [Phycisphaerae bacterium]
MSFGLILKAKREELNLTQDQLAEMTDISKPYLSAVETGRAVNPPSEAKLRRLEKALQFAPGQLLRLARLERTPTAVREEMERLRAENRKFRSVLEGGDLDELYKSGKLAELAGVLPSRRAAKALDSGIWVPVINRVSAGYPQWHGDMDYPPGVADDYVRCPDLHDPQAFAARVAGDSMEPKYREGDIVIFSPQADVADGDDCFVRRADTHETNFKRVFQEGEDQLRLQPRNEKYPPQTLSREQVNGLYKAVYRVEKLG